jgi:hypothetical protein
MALKRIHVNQHVIRGNARDGTAAPPLTVKTSSENIRGHRVSINGPSVVIYRPERPLACGARVWVETRSPIVVVSDGKSRVVE